MNYNKIRKMDISNGPGVRVSLFVQGCAFHCKNCFNPETHDFKGGKEFTTEEVEKIMNLCGLDYIRGLSILGGEPLHPNNLESVTMLAEYFKYKYPCKDLWVWTGFQFENLRNEKIMDFIDVLVDGQFKEECYNPSLKWRGSSNQRVINVPKSIRENKIIEL